MNQTTLAARLILTSMALLWCLAILLPPVVSSLESPPKEVSSELYTFFSPICHQAEARSLHLMGFKLGVCARCFGIYAGFLAGILIWPLLKGSRSHLGRTKPWLFWALAALPMTLDVLLGVAGLYERTIATRVATGVFFGAAASGLLGPLLEQTIEQLIARTTREGVPYESKT